MDADISKVGEQFGTYGYAVVDGDWDDTVTSLLPFDDGTARSSVSTTSTTGVGHQYPPTRLPSHTMTSSYAQRSTNSILGHDHPTYATVLRRGMQQPISAPSRAIPPTPMLGNARQEMQFQTPGQPDHISRQEYYQQFMSHMRPQTYAQVLRSSPSIGSGLPSNRNPAVPLRAAQDFYGGQISDAAQNGQRPNPTQYASPFQEWVQAGNPETSPYVGARAHIPQNDMSNNVNWQPGIAEPFGSVGDWAGQPRATGHRTRPPMNTHLSHERDEATYQSPVPTSSLASSSRTSGRRSRGQRQSGTYEHRCNSCGCGYDTLAELNHHLRSHTPYEQRAHVCYTCGKRFTYGKDLRRHLPVHDPNAPKYFCPFPRCRYATIGFTREDNLERHLRTHAVDSVQQSSRPASQQG